MKEINDIIAAYELAKLAHKKMALATVVHVEGSSYRRPGARMLVTDDGQLTGAISGGCLEGDALRKALLAIAQQQNKLVTYDTSDDDDNTLGVQLGCNGIIHILFEPIDLHEKNHPIELLKQSVQKRQNAVLITLFSLAKRNSLQPGTCALYLEGDHQLTDLQKVAKQTPVFQQFANEAKRLEDSFFIQHNLDDSPITAFVEYLKTPPSLVIVGAGNDALPLMEMAAILGWNIIVADGRSSHATRQRFPKANKVLVSKAPDLLAQIQPDPQTFFVLMTHNYNYDYALLKELIRRNFPSYIGALGPKKKLDRMFGDMALEGILVSEAQKKNIFGPTGLDLGAETSEEIALSILAEIKAVMVGHPGTSLRDKKEPIHIRPDHGIVAEHSSDGSFTCSIIADI